MHCQGFIHLLVENHVLIILIYYNQQEKDITHIYPYVMINEKRSPLIKT